MCVVYWVTGDYPLVSVGSTVLLSSCHKSCHAGHSTIACFVFLNVFMCVFVILCFPSQTWFLRRLCCISQHAAVSLGLLTSCLSSLEPEKPFNWPTERATPHPLSRHHVGTNVSLSFSQSKCLHRDDKELNRQGIMRIFHTLTPPKSALQQQHLPQKIQSFLTLWGRGWGICCLQSEQQFWTCSEHWLLLCTNSCMPVYQQAFIALLFVVFTEQ